MKRRVAVCAGLLLLPYLSAKLDPTLRQKYNFEYARDGASGPPRAACPVVHVRRAGAASTVRITTRPLSPT